jgi:hypothetical protein
MYFNLEVASVIVTLVSAAVNLVQYILSKKAKLLHVADMDNIYTTSYRAIEEIDKAIQCADSGEDPIRFIYDAKSAINSVREKCQNRVKHLVNRLPERSFPWDSIIVKNESHT